MPSNTKIVLHTIKAVHHSENTYCLEYVNNRESHDREYF